MVFYGASGHAKVIIEALLAGGGEVTGIFDDSPSVVKLMHFPVAGKYQPGRFPGVEHIISIGDNHIRKRIAEAIDETFGVVIHPRACISKSSALGKGSVVMGGVVVNAEAKIGAHVILNTSCVVDHDCVIEDYAHISPNATLCGGVHIGEGTHLGAGATVIQNIRIGKWATIGAGSVVIEDVPDHAVVVGVPGSIRKFNHG